MFSGWPCCPGLNCAAPKLLRDRYIANIVLVLHVPACQDLLHDNCFPITTFPAPPEVRVEVAAAGHMRSKKLRVMAAVRLYASTICHYLTGLLLYKHVHTCITWPSSAPTIIVFYIYKLSLHMHFHMFKLHIYTYMSYPLLVCHICEFSITCCLLSNKYTIYICQLHAIYTTYTHHPQEQGYNHADPTCTQ